MPCLSKTLLCLALVCCNLAIAEERGRKVAATEIENVRLTKRANEERYSHRYFFDLLESNGWGKVEDNPFIYYRGRTPYTGYVVGRNEDHWYGGQPQRFAGNLKDGVRDGVWKFWDVAAPGDTFYLQYRGGIKSSKRLDEMRRNTEYAGRVDYKYKYGFPRGDTQITYDVTVTDGNVTSVYYTFQEGTDVLTASYRDHDRALVPYSFYRNDVGVAWVERSGKRYVWYFTPLSSPRARHRGVSIDRGEDFRVKSIKVKEQEGTNEYFPIDSTALYPQLFERFSERGERTTFEMDWTEIDRAVEKAPPANLLAPVLAKSPLGRMLPIE